TLDLDALDLEDANVYKLLGSGRTAGVFQFESPLATDCLRNMKCDRFDDLVATNALLRPGPLDAGMHLVFIRRKRGEETVRYPHDALREVLGPTYGVIVYQEQVMRIANVLGGAARWWRPGRRTGRTSCSAGSRWRAVTRTGRRPRCAPSRAACRRSRPRGRARPGRGWCRGAPRPCGARRGSPSAS